MNASDSEPGIERVVGDGIEMSFDPVKRLIRFRFLRQGFVSTGKQAKWTVEQLRRWLESSPETFGAMADLGGCVDADVEWRATLHEYLAPRAGRLVTAWYNPSPLLRVMLEMFVAGTPGTNGAVCDSEAEARQWLMQRGFG